MRAATHVLKLKWTQFASGIHALSSKVAGQLKMDAPDSRVFSLL